MATERTHPSQMTLSASSQQPPPPHLKRRSTRFSHLVILLVAATFATGALAASSSSSSSSSSQAATNNKKASNVRKSQSGSGHSEANKPTTSSSSSSTQPPERLQRMLELMASAKAAAKSSSSPSSSSMREIESELVAATPSSSPTTASASSSASRAERAEHSPTASESPNISDSSDTTDADFPHLGFGESPGEVGVVVPTPRRPHLLDFNTNYRQLYQHHHYQHQHGGSHPKPPATRYLKPPPATSSSSSSSAHLEATNSAAERQQQQQDALAADYALEQINRAQRGSQHQLLEVATRTNYGTPSSSDASSAGLEQGVSVSSEGVVLYPTSPQQAAQPTAAPAATPAAAASMPVGAEHRPSQIRVVFNNNPQFIIGRDAPNPPHPASGKRVGATFPSGDYHTADESSLEETKVMAPFSQSQVAHARSDPSDPSNELPCARELAALKNRQQQLLPANLEQINLKRPDSDLESNQSPPLQHSQRQQLPPSQPPPIPKLASGQQQTSVDEVEQQVNVPFEEMVKSGMRPPLRMVISMQNKDGDVLKMPINFAGATPSQQHHHQLNLGGHQMRIHFEPQPEPPVSTTVSDHKQRKLAAADENTPLGGDVFDPNIVKPFGAAKPRAMKPRAKDDLEPVATPPAPVGSETPPPPPASTQPPPPPPPPPSITTTQANQNQEPPPVNINNHQQQQPPQAQPGKDRDCVKGETVDEHLFHSHMNLFLNRTLASMLSQFHQAFGQQLQSLPAPPPSPSPSSPSLPASRQQPPPQMLALDSQPNPMGPSMASQQQQQPHLPPQRHTQLPPMRPQQQQQLQQHNQQQQQQFQERQRMLDQQEDLVVAMMATNMSAGCAANCDRHRPLAMTVITPPSGTTVDEAIRAHAHPSQTVAILQSIGTRLPQHPLLPTLMQQHHHLHSSSPPAPPQGNQQQEMVAQPFPVEVRVRRPPNGAAANEPPPLRPPPVQAQQQQQQPNQVVATNGGEPVDPEGFAAAASERQQEETSPDVVGDELSYRRKRRRRSVEENEYGRQLEPADRLATMAKKEAKQPKRLDVGAEVMQPAASDEHQNEVDGEGDSDSDGSEDPSEGDSLDSRSDSDLDSDSSESDLDDSPDDSVGFGDAEDEPYNQGASSDASPAHFEIPQIEINPNTLKQKGCRTVLREVQEIPMNGLGVAQASGRPGSGYGGDQPPQLGRRVRRQVESPPGSINSRKVTSIVMTKECHFPNSGTSQPEQQPKQAAQPAPPPQLIAPAQVGPVNLSAAPPLTAGPPRATPIKRRSVLPRPPAQQQQQQQQLQLKQPQVDLRDRDFYEVSDSRPVAQKLYKPPSDDHPFHTLSYRSSNGEPEPTTSGSSVDVDDEDGGGRLVLNQNRRLPNGGRSRTVASESSGRRQLPADERRALLDPDHDDTDPTPRGKPAEPEPASELDAAAAADVAADDDDGEHDDEQPPVTATKTTRRQSPPREEADRPAGKSFRLEHRVSRPAERRGLAGELGRLPAGRRLTSSSSSSPPPRASLKASKRAGGRQQVGVTGGGSNPDEASSLDEADDDDDDEETSGSGQHQKKAAAPSAVPSAGKKVVGELRADGDERETGEPDFDPDYNPPESRLPAHSKPKRAEKSFAYVQRDVPLKDSRNPDDFVVSYGRGNVQTEHEDYDSERDQPASSSSPRLQRRSGPAALAMPPAHGHPPPLASTSTAAPTLALNSTVATGAQQVRPKQQQQQQHQWQQHQMKPQMKRPPPAVSMLSG